MGRGYGSVVAMYTAVSIGGIVWQINSSLQKVLPEKVLDPVEAAGLLQPLLQSSFTIGLLVNLLLNFFVLVALFVKTIFFGTLTFLETQKVVERLISYILFKGLFLTWVVQPEMTQLTLWLSWFAFLGVLKMFQGLARDRLDRLNASPTAAISTHLRVFSVLVLVLLTDIFWIQLCLIILKDVGLSTLMLLLFEPLSIGFETLQAGLVHGMQLLDTWNRQTSETLSSADTTQQSDRSAAVTGVAWESRGMMVRNCSFFMDLVSLLLALGHCLHIWWLRGLAFQVVDAILFLNLRALVNAMLKRVKGFMRTRTAMKTLQGALPDASRKDLVAYDDDCAICKEPMARAKKLPCAHLFHLSCLRSWLDQGLAETYSCPTCRRPLPMGSLRSNGRDEGQFSRHLSHSFSAAVANSWRGDSEWMGDVDLRRSSRIETMMRRFSVSHHQQRDTSSSDSSSNSNNTSLSRWMFWRGANVAATSGRVSVNISPQMGSMMRMVKEVLPHVSDDLIIEDLRRTNCVTATVNNLV